MLLRPLVAIGALLACTGPSSACLRPKLDDRAVQWSSAIVRAKLLAVGKTVQLGTIETPQGVKGGKMPNITTKYSYRVYTFEVSDSFDGPLQKDQKISVVRLFAFVDNPMIICSQHLTQNAVGQSFVLLLRPVSEFKLKLPKGAKIEAGKDPLMVVHLAPAQEGKDDGLTALRARIADVRGAEKQVTPQRVGEALDAVVNAKDDVKAEPAVRELSRMGPKTIPQLRTALSTATGDGKVRLERLVQELSPPDPATTTARGPVQRVDDGTEEQ